MADRQPRRRQDSARDGESTESVEVTIGMLRQQIMGMSTRVTTTRNRASTYGDRDGAAATAASQNREESQEECERRVDEAKKRHKRETEKRVHDYEATVGYLKEQIAEEERRSCELRGRLEECRTAKNLAVEELNQAREHYDEQVKKLQKCIDEGSKEIKLLQNEREKYLNANSTLKQLQENMLKAEKELQELQNTSEDLHAELEAKDKVIDQLEKAKRELEESKEKLEKECNSVKEQMEKYMATFKEQSNQDSVRKVLEDQVEKVKKEKDEQEKEHEGDKRRLKKLQDDLTSIQDSSKEAERMYIRRIAELNGDVTKMRTEKRELTRKIKELESSDSKLKETKTEIEAKVEDLESQIRSKSEQLQCATSAKAELKTQIEVLEQDKKSLQKKIGDLEASLESSKVATKKKADALNEQIELIQARDREVKVLKANVKTLKETTKVLDDQLFEFESVLNEKVRQIQEGKNLQDLLDQENKDIREQLRKVRIELNEAKSMNAYTEQCMQSTQSSLKSIAESKNSEVMAMMQKLEVADRRNEELLSEVKRMTSHLTQLEAEKFELRKEVESSKAERDRYTRDLHGLLKAAVDAKEVSYQLSADLEKAAEEARTCRDEIDELNEKVAEMDKSMAIKDVMYNTRTRQQNKLIQHLTDELAKYQEKHDKKKKKANIFTPKRQEREAVTPRTPASAQLQRKYMTPTFVSSNPTPAYLETEKMEVLKLEETKENLLTKLKTLQMNATPVAKKTQTLPAPKKEECVLLKETSNTLAGAHTHPKPASEKQHRWVERDCQNPVRCKGCRDTINKGSLMCVCSECSFEFHFMCSVASADKCGFPVRASEMRKPKLDQVFPVLPYEEESIENFTSGAAKIMTAKMAEPENLFMKIEDARLNVYMSEHTKYKPVESFELNEYTTVYFRINPSKEPALEQFDEGHKFVLKVVFYSAQQESSYIYMFLRDKVDKRNWTRAINRNSKSRFLSGDSTLFSDLSVLDDEGKENQAMSFVEKSLMQDEGISHMYVNCVVVFPNSQLYVFGCEEGLYSQKMIGTKPVKIQGPGPVYQIEFVEKTRIAVFVEGEGRSLSTADLRLFKSCANAAECSEPQLKMEIVPRTKDCYNLSSGCNSSGESIVVAASGSYMLICMMDQSNKSLSVVRELYVNEAVTSLLVAPHTILFGNSNVFEVETKNFHIEEFLDSTSDAISMLKIINESYGNYPVAMFDVSACNDLNAKEPEFLICFQDIGIFVDSFGRPTRDGDLLWTHIPFFIEYRHPFLYIFHSTTIEVKKLDKNSYRKLSSKGKSCSKTGKKALAIQQHIHIPVSRFYPVKLKSKSAPRYIGKGKEGVVFAFNETGSTKVLELIAS